MTRRKAPGEKKKPGPQPGFRARAAEAASVVVAAAAASSASAVTPRHDDPLQSNRNIDTMPEAELRQYARQIGLLRDADSVAVERLRANCKSQVFALIEDD